MAHLLTVLGECSSALEDDILTTTADVAEELSAGLHSANQLTRTGIISPAAADRMPVTASAQSGMLDKFLQCLGSDASEWEMHQCVIARDASGATVLHWAAIGGDLQVCQALLDNGARADALDGEGRLPADVATNEAVRSLLTTALDGQFCESDGYDSGADDRPWH